MNKYADVAIPAAIEVLQQKGADRSSLMAKIAGGSCMFDLAKEGQGDIGQRNVEAVKDILAENNIALIGEDTGGSLGRTVEFSLQTGEVLVRTVRGGETIL